jgi:NMT1 family protein
MRWMRVSWRDLTATLGPILVIAALGILLALKYASPAPPDTIVITSGAPDSAFGRTAERYRDILARNGIKLTILRSDGALENLQRLRDKRFKVDVGFVQGGLATEGDKQILVSLGSIYHEPLWVFSRCAHPVRELSQLKGKRVAVGPEGSGTRVLALELLKANGLDEKAVTVLPLAGEDAGAALRDHSADAAFLMGDSARMQLVRALIQTKGLCLVDFAQSEAYVRKFAYLTKLTLPTGAIDLGQNVPAQDIAVIGPTAQIIARPDLHPALSDLLIEAAREVHGKPGLFRHAREFPQPLETDFPISEDAERYYKSGKRFLYRHLPFWLASLADRLLVVLVPIAAIMIPGLRIVPSLYRWRVRARIYRWYGALMALEREMLADPAHTEREKINERLDAIERGVNRIKIPLAFADQMYVLREHIGFVRNRLGLAAPATEQKFATSAARQ